MALFNEFKEKFNKAAQSVTSMTREGVEITRLSSESRSISNELIVLYEKIGRIFVESEGTDRDSLEPLVAQARQLREKLEEVERKKLQRKNQNRCPSCGALSAKNARFCASCGQRMPEIPLQTPAAPEAASAQYCPSCGAMRSASEDYCAVCGHSYRTSAPEAEAPARRYIVLNPNDDSAEAPSSFDAD